MSLRVAILGRGRVGRGLAGALEGGEVEPKLTSGSRPRRAAIAEADVVVLAVPDGAIRPTAERIAPHVRRGAAVLHCAGARGAEELAPIAAAGAHTGVMHPLVSFPDPRRSPDLAGTTFVLTGSRLAVSAARRIARAAGARAVAASVHGPAYHAAAALLANGAAALATVSVGVVERLGMDRRDAERAMGALLRTVADNVERMGVPRALTGPIMRGDAETVRRHRRALDAGSRRAYDAVAPAILACAQDAGLEPDRASAVRRALRDRASP